MTRTHRTALAASALALALGLAACAEPLPTPTPAATPVQAPPVLTPECSAGKRRRAVCSFKSGSWCRRIKRC